VTAFKFRAHATTDVFFGKIAFPASTSNRRTVESPLRRQDARRLRAGGLRKRVSGNTLTAPQATPLPAHLAGVYGADIAKVTRSKITDRVLSR
jgi:hypothetical protein